MTRETRLVVTLLAFGVVGVASLSFVAKQYRGHTLPGAAAASGSEAASDRAARRVEGFLAARVAAQGVCKRYGDKMKEVAGAVTGNFDGVAGKRMGYGLDVISTYKIERSNAFRAHGMDDADYAAVRGAWRSWMSGGPGVDAALAAAFSSRRADAESAGLGAFEAFDDAIR